MNKKQQGKQQQNPATKTKETKEVKEIQLTPLPNIEDFFTQFLQKKKKPLYTKIDEIAELEARDRESLKPDQKEKINKKGEILEKIKSFDDIRLLYLEAHAKKGAVASEQNSKSDEVRDAVVTKVVNLFGVGHALQHFDKNAQLLGQTFSSDQMVAIQEAYYSLKKIDSLDEFEAAKKSLKVFVSNEEMSVATGKFFEEYNFDTVEHHKKHADKHHESGHHEHQKEHQVAHEQKQHKHEHKEEHHHQAKEAHHAHVEQAPRKQSAKVEEKPQKRLFADESDDEEPHHQHHHHQHHQKEEQQDLSSDQGHNDAQGDEGDNVPPSFLVPLPEGEDKKVDEFRQKHHKHHGNRPYKPRNYDGQRPPKPHHEAGESAPQRIEGEKKEHVHTQEGQKQERHREHRPHNDNYRQDGQRRQHRQYQEGEEGDRRQHKPRRDYEGGDGQRAYRQRRDYEGDGEGAQPRYYRNQSGRQGEYQESYRPKREHNSAHPQGGHQQPYRRQEQQQQGNGQQTN